MVKASVLKTEISNFTFMGSNPIPFFFVDYMVFFSVCDVTGNVFVLEAKIEGSSPSILKL